jgi:hypothetical protein
MSKNPNPAHNYVFAAASQGGAIKLGKLQKYHNKKDKWQPYEVELSARGLVWSSGSTLQDHMGGSQRNLTPQQMVACSLFSDIGVHHAFEVVSTIKGGKVYKFATDSDDECDEWIESISAVIDRARVSAGLGCRVEGRRARRSEQELGDCVVGVETTTNPVSTEKLGLASEKTFKVDHMGLGKVRITRQPAVPARSLV